MLVPRAVDVPFTYGVPEGAILHAGDVVDVPFGRERIWGVVWKLTRERPDFKNIKHVEAVFEGVNISERMRQFVDWVAEYTLSPRGNVLGMVLSVPKVFEPMKRKTKPLTVAPAETPNVPTLSPAQKKAADTLVAAVGADKYATTLLEGVTGSGKTEVYMEAIEAVIKKGKQVLLLMPEIVLTAQMKQRLQARFGVMPTEWHSHLTPKARREHWQQIAGGEAKLVIGARSALFLPFKSLGLIIVDEEHESAYKQEDGVVYHGRDMAVARGYHEKIPVVLVSATPSLETMCNVEEGKFTKLHLPERHGGAELPDIQVIDMRQEHLEMNHWISHPLKAAIAEALSKGEQALLYLNRRGYAPLTLCRACGHRMRCPHCTAWLVEHKKTGRLQCHHCGYHAPMVDTCPSCGEHDSLIACGPGVERLEEEVRAIFPDAQVAVMTSDTLDNPEEARTLLKKILNREIDIIIGTQMVTKGHHFPHLTLVGVVDADVGLEGGDLRAAEKSYQLLHQVAGRAGREGLKGRAMVQTYAPESGLMQALRSDDRAGFASGEKRAREQAGMPPYGRLAALILSGADEQKVKRAAIDMVKAAPRKDGVKILGPAPAPLALLRGKYRYRILVKAGKKTGLLQPLIREWAAGQKLPSTIRMKVDIDPYSFM
ncbi:MAG: primosomal protein N' [Proteobacteria bacterium]|nr:primosomal protein N' [Pseudomonadota bacterium]